MEQVEQEPAEIPHPIGLRRLERVRPELVPQDRLDPWEC